MLYRSDAECVHVDAGYIVVFEVRAFDGHRGNGTHVQQRMPCSQDTGVLAQVILLSIGVAGRTRNTRNFATGPLQSTTRQ